MTRVYFYCAEPQSADVAAYHHVAICIAEGLKALGVPFYSNIDYWQIDPEREEFLFCHDPDVTPDDCSVVVVSLAWFLTGNPFPQEIFKANRSYKTAYLDRQDGARTFAYRPEFRQFDYVLKTHFCSDTQYPDNFYPWFFGFSHRILNALKTPPDFAGREKTLLVNFRNKSNAHTIRGDVYRRFLPAIEKIITCDTRIDALTTPPATAYDYLMWYQTGKRHYPSYYDRLQKNAACACFGGYFVSSWPADRGSNLNRLQQKIISRAHLRTGHVMQWDSWRLWESWVAGCATFHLDFEKYHISLPVMPQNWVDYIGVDLDNISDTIERITEEPDLLEKIAHSGRRWALENYGSKQVAQRFLDCLAL